ncbi:MAG: AI-2E family transporter [Acidobacteriota bacterium]
MPVRKDRFYLSMVLFLIGVLGYLTYVIMSPFLIAIAWSIVLSIVFYPVYAFVARRVRIRAVASVLTVILMLIIIVGPFSYVTISLINELQIVGAKISENRLGSVNEIVQKLETWPFFEKMRSYPGLQDLLSEDVIVENIRKAGKSLIENFSVRITNILGALIDFIIVLFTTFFLLKDGPGLLSKAKDYMPFSTAQKEKLAEQIKDMIVSTVYGGVIVAILQGLLGGIAYSVIGIEAPVMWGIAMSIMSFVPLVGTFAIWGPTAVYLVITGDYVHGIGLFLFGVLVISMVDNILKPLIIGSRTKMPTIIILFSVLGGIKFFGMIGLIMGPLITAVFISVIEIFRSVEGGTVLS